MVSRKRGREEMEASETRPVEKPTMLEKLRNTWEFANLMQYIFFFGKALKIDEDLDIDDLEQECLKPEKSKVLNDIGLALLKFVSSHRGLTPELFDEYTRRQYVAKAPHRNPFGEEEDPKKFVDFNVFLKLKVLVQLSQWTLLNPDRMRERMPEVKESEQTQWRIEELGWDRHERTYFVLDDNRLYRRTDPAPPPPPTQKAKPKSTSKKAKATARANRRRRAKEREEAGEDADVDTGAENVEEAEKSENDDGFGGRKWECIAVTLGQYQDFLASIQKSRDPEEKALYGRITETALPEIERLEASHLRKKQKQERELLNLQKLATAKRSSRLEAKFEREKQEQEAAEAERKRREDLAAAKRDQEKQKSMEAARESRMMTREQRLKDREFKRLLHEEELANLSEENKKIEAGESQRSERHLKAEMERKKKDLAALEEEEDWMFDCAKCGIYGCNLDDGSPSIACEKCNVWQHTACLGFSQEEAKKDDFHFVCRDCKRREEDSKKPKIPTLKFHIGPSSSPPQSHSKSVEVVVNGVATNGLKRKSGDGLLPPTKKFKLQEYRPARPAPDTDEAPRPAHSNNNGKYNTIMNGPQLSPQGQLKMPSTADNSLPFPRTESSAKPPAHTYHRTSPNRSQPPFGTFQVPIKALEHDSGNQGKAADSQKHESQSKAKPYPFNHPIESQNHRPYAHQYPRPAGSPPLQGSHQVYTNGNLYQAPHFGYHQHGGAFPIPNGTHPSYQTYRVYEQPNGPPTSVSSAHDAPKTSTASEHLPPYMQSSASDSRSYERGLPSQRPLNYRPGASVSSSLHPKPSHINSNTQERHVSSHAARNSRDHLPTNNQTSVSPTHYSAPILTPGPQIQIPRANGHRYDPVPSTETQTQSPKKHPSPPTSFTHSPASSPMSNHPPLQPPNGPISPGISPQKHSPPPPSPTQGHIASAAVAPAVLPFAPKLSPSPTQSSSVAPLKHDVQGLGTLAREDASAPILSPISAPQDLSSPIKQAPVQQAQESPIQSAKPHVEAVNGHAST